MLFLRQTIALNGIYRKRQGQRFSKCHKKEKTNEMMREWEIPQGETVLSSRYQDGIKFRICIGSDVPEGSEGGSRSRWERLQAKTQV